MTSSRPKRFPLGLADLVRESSAAGARGAQAKPAAPAKSAIKPALTHAPATKVAPGASAERLGQAPTAPALAAPKPTRKAAAQPSFGAHARQAAARQALAKPVLGQQVIAKTAAHKTSSTKVGATPAGASRPASSMAQAKPAPAGKPLSVSTPRDAAAHKGASPSHAAHPAHTVNPLARPHRDTQREPSRAHPHVPAHELQPQVAVTGVLNSDRVRERMVERLRASGIADPRVLAALAVVPRHQFVDAGLATQAYEDAALPIGHHQTISKPSVVARMIELATAGRSLNKVLEIGTGCGYQAAVLSQVARDVYSIERIKPLYERAKSNLRPLRVPNIRLHYGDGREGLPAVAPFDAILLAAAGLEVPQALLEQLEIGGRLIAPVGGESQVLTLIERVAPTQWRESRLDRVFFVPLKSGVV